MEERVLQIEPPLECPTDIICDKDGRLFVISNHGNQHGVQLLSQTDSNIWKKDTIFESYCIYGICIAGNHFFVSHSEFAEMELASNGKLVLLEEEINGFHSRSFLYTIDQTATNPNRQRIIYSNQ